MKIEIGAGQGLSYLHSKENIVHGNLTSSNILLDAEMNAKISDFELSRLMTTATNSNVITIVGALGYRALELTKLKKANKKTNVYIYGDILLELLTRRALGKSMTTESGMDLPQWVASIVKEEWTNEVFDLELMKDAPTSGDEFLNTLQLAMHPTPSSRQDMDEIVHRLEEIKPKFTLSSSPEVATTLPRTSIPSPFPFLSNAWVESIISKFAGKGQADATNGDHNKINSSSCSVPPNTHKNDDGNSSRNGSGHEGAPHNEFPSFMQSYPSGNAIGMKQTGSITLWKNIV